ncbi:MAG TPA: translocation/assembly module TamB domain-containing protein, partial [Polyangiaceae bacterium]|nr:translocation/assembly module TamB domain-containing protein [Polyangiaceae bacterium]
MAPIVPDQYRRDAGRLISRILCGLFGLIGAIPLLAVLLVRSPPVQAWAAAETAKLLHEELGVEASYDVTLELVPLRLIIREIVVPGSDGRGPALKAQAIQVTPRVFSLVAGKLDAGDIEIERPVARLVFEDGKLQNLKYRLKSRRSASSGKLERAPFTSLAISEAAVDVTWDGRRVDSQSVDMDLIAEPGMAFELALRLAEGTIVSQRTAAEQDDAPGTPRAPSAVIDEDAVCRLDLRLSQTPEQITVRRLSLSAVMDHDPARGSRPSCKAALDEGNPHNILARLSSVRVNLGKPGAGKSPIQSVNGHATVRLPAPLMNRFVEAPPFAGWVAFSGEISHDGLSRLPQITGRAHGSGVTLDGIALAHDFSADVQVVADTIRIPTFKMQYANADVTITGGRIEPFKTNAPLTVEKIDTRGMTFPGLMRDLSITNDTIVQWDLETAVVTDVRGTLYPFLLDAEVKAETANFEVTNGAYHDPKRKHMIGVDRATVRGQIKVDLDAFRLVNTRADFGNSFVNTRLVSIGFDGRMHLIVPPRGAIIDLRDISPLVEIPMAGKAQIEAEMTGLTPDVVITGNASVEGFEFGGFPLGDIVSSKFRFVPLKLDLTDVVAKKGSSPYRASSAHLDFDSNATVKVDALVESQALDLRDLLAMWNFENDPRWTHLRGRGTAKARVRYLLGGPEDRCGGGNLRVVGSSTFDRFEAFEERYDSGSAEYDFHWTDFAATYRGISLDVPTFQLSKGAGMLAGSFRMRPGAKLEGKLVGTAVPISKIDAMGERVSAVDGEVTTAVGEISGTLDAVRIVASATTSSMKLDEHVLPPSEFSVRLEPKLQPLETVGQSRCGQPIAGGFDQARWEKDEVQGTFYLSGQLFGGQAKFNDLELSAQRSKVWRGKTQLENFNLAAVLELFAPGSAADFSGTLSGEIDIGAYALADPASADLKLLVSAFEARQAGLQAKLASPQSLIKLSRRQLSVDNLALAVTAPGGQSGVFDVRGELRNLGKAPEVDAQLRLRPTDLSAFTGLMPQIQRAKGRVDATFRVNGDLARPNVAGGLSIANGEVEVKGLKAPISDLNVEVQVDPTQVRVTRGSARIGNGELELTGRAPIQGTSLGTARADLQVRGLSLALEDGIRVTLDSKLRAVYEPSESGDGPLPRINGDVTVTSFDYTRPMSMTADLTTLAQRGRRTEVESYDPERDVVEFDIQLRSLRPLHIENDLLDTDLMVDDTGLRLKGTNQRFGMLGRLKFKPGGQISMRNHEFEIRQGWVRFDDLSRIEPQVDVTAVTDYRRFEDVGSADAAGAGAVSSGDVSSSSMGGQWRINLHAYGDPENLKIDLTSTPNLPQDDIFLLLTVGLTRAELDQN